MSLARISDPETSRQAAREIERDGSRKRQENAILRLVQWHPGCTASEYELMSGIKAHKRMAGLVRRGLIVSGEAKRCPLTGKRAQTWWPV